MSDTFRNENDPIVDPREGHVPPEAVEGAHDADGTMGRVAGTGSGLISGALVGTAVGGPIGTVIGAVAGAVLGAAAGNAAHHVGDDQDDVNVETGSGGDLGKNAGAGAGAISGLILGATTGPVGAVAGAVAGGMLGAAAGNAAKDMGGDSDNPNVVPASYAGNDPVVGTSSSGTNFTSAPMGAGVPGGVIGGSVGGASMGSMGATGAPLDIGVSGAGLGSSTGEEHGHNIVTGEEAHTGAGKAGLGTGAVVGGLIGTAVGGPVGAVVGGAIGSLTGGAVGDATEAAESGSVSGVGLGGTGIGTGVTERAGDALTVPASNFAATDASTMAAPLPTPVAPPVAPPVVPVAAASTRSDDDVTRLSVVEESLAVGKEMRQTGEVEVSKHVVEEQVQVPVTLRHEEVVVTRHAVDRPAVAGETVMGDTEVIRVPVHEEVAQVTKEVRVAEEIEIEKRAVSQQQTISDTVRREVVDVNQPTTGTMGTGADLTPGNNVPGVQTGGLNADGSPDTRGLSEKAADALTGDKTDDKTGKHV